MAYRLKEEEINDQIMNGEIAETTLATDQRVISRITDGIYRQPGSTLRELIINAYDADATRVILTTDAPRFSEIRIRDNGNGMSVSTLTHILHSIGGSGKRTLSGKKYGITDNTNPNLSPKGRPLIGKIGIGLFSVAQLSRQFRIITKQQNENYRLIADIFLYTYSDEQLKDIDVEENEEYISGKVQIWKSSADDIEGHGTEIIVRDILPRVRELLQSKSTWDLIDSPNEDEENIHEAPFYHIGKVNSNNVDELANQENLPWADKTPPEERFMCMVNQVLSKFEPGKTPRNPKLDKIFDKYFQTIWNLSLSLPLIPYIDKHPFDVDSTDELKIFKIANTMSEQATEIVLPTGKTLREILNLDSPKRIENDEFSVCIDEIELFRPQPFLRMPRTTQAIPFPIMAVGKYSYDSKNFGINISGGGLEFEAYLLWTHVVAPSENKGVLIRIHDASGTLFDANFLQYQGGENTRASQTTAEIFVLKGLEPALNIDRESFNYVHPHYQIITKWLHSAMRQLYNKLKQVQREYTQIKSNNIFVSQLTELEEKTEPILEKAYEKYGTKPDGLIFSHKGKLELEDVSENTIILDIHEEIKQHSIDIERKKLIMKVLAAYGLLDQLDQNEIDNLYNDIAKIFE